MVPWNFFFFIWIILRGVKRIVSFLQSFFDHTKEIFNNWHDLLKGFVTQHSLFSLDR